MKPFVLAATVGVAAALAAGNAFAGKDLDARARGALGVDDKWVYNIVKQVGNYGESYDRHVGPNSLLKIDRGVNKLWAQGGLQYAPPIR